MFPKAGLYAITKNEKNNHKLIDQVEAALMGGAHVIQYRDKTRTLAQQRPIATALKSLCEQYSATFIINDHIELALSVDAHGVHLGLNDHSIAAARSKLGLNAIIGVSCYDSLERAEMAYQQGADYIALGRFFSSNNKPDAAQASPGLLTTANKKYALPIVAIGGVTPKNGASLLTAGAHLLAAIDSVFGSGDPQKNARKFISLFPKK